ncbi:MAG TPA: M15 family metallopeptidase [Sulfurovum sp.]|uniref:M15 family metallopeptidase n=1 Tax=Sulfurovum sp. TaxID=1969726 RepID=UPI002F92F502
MVKIVYMILLSAGMAFAAFESESSEITPQIKQRMVEGNSWRKGCPVPLNDLRYLRMTHINFNGEEERGEMIVHKEVSAEVIAIFEALYAMGYPIRKMKLVSEYSGSDWHSIESDNTSAFNCRKATGSQKWSKHSYGKAIDINPIENPYISRKGTISHKASERYRKRAHQKSTYADKALLLKNDAAVQLFKKHGWKWGGDWSGVKDYQHFSK